MNGQLCSCSHTRVRIVDMRPGGSVEARTCMGECVWEHVACGAPSRCVGYWLCECRVVPLPAVGLGFDVVQQRREGLRTSGPLAPAHRRFSRRAGKNSLAFDDDTMLRRRYSIKSEWAVGRFVIALAMATGHNLYVLRPAAARAAMSNTLIYAWLQTHCTTFSDTTTTLSTVGWRDIPYSIQQSCSPHGTETVAASAKHRRHRTAIEPNPDGCDCGERPAAAITTVEPSATYLSQVSSSPLAGSLTIFAYTGVPMADCSLWEPLQPAQHSSPPASACRSDGGERAYYPCACTPLVLAELRDAAGGRFTDRYVISPICCYFAAPTISTATITFSHYPYSTYRYHLSTTFASADPPTAATDASSPLSDVCSYASTLGAYLLGARLPIGADTSLGAHSSDVCTRDVSSPACSLNVCTLGACSLNVCTPGSCSFDACSLGACTLGASPLNVCTPGARSLVRADESSQSPGPCTLGVCSLDTRTLGACSHGP